MGKDLSTLIEDIQTLFNEDVMIDEDKIKALGQAVAETVGRCLNENKKSSTLRMSNLGTECDRKLWYTVNESEGGEPLPFEAKMKFMFGHILEDILLFMADAAGHKVENQQREVDIEGIKGHIDCTIDGVLVDCKSASSFAFKKFSMHSLESDDPFGYIDQLNGYHFALRETDENIDKTKFAFLAIDKQLGHICLDIYSPNMVLYNQKVEQKKEMLRGSIPKRGYFDEPDGKSGNRKLPVSCSYCPFKQKCWPGLRTFLYSNGPRYLTNVAKMPDVPEV